MRRLLWIVPLLVLVGLIGWRVGQKSAETGGGPGGPGAAAGRGGQGGGRGGAGAAGGRGGTSVEVAVAAPTDIVDSVEAVGTAASPLTVRLSPTTSGRITYLQARVGDHVSAGQLLVRIDPSTAEGGVLQGLASVSEAQSRLAQAQVTVGASDIGIENEIRTQSAAIARAQASLNQARKTLEAQVAAAQAAVEQQEAAVRSAQADVVSAQANVTSAEANAKSAEARERRTRNLFNQGFIAAQDLDDAVAAAEAARSAVDVATQNVAANRAKVVQAQAQRNAAQAQVTVVRRQAQASVLTAQADLRSAQAAYQTAVANRAQKPANRRNLEALQASVRAAQGQLAEASATKANTELRSTVDGFVTERSADPGTLAQPGTPVLTVSVVKQIYVETSYPLDYSGEVRPGGEATVTFDSIPDRTFVGRIKDVNQAADPQSRQFLVRVAVDNPDETIRPGMFGRVRVILEHHQVPVAVPITAVTTKPNSGTTLTMVDENNTAHVVTVQTGAKDDKNVEIVQGLSAGQRVVMIAARAVQDGAKVQIVTANASGARGRAGGGRRSRGQGPGSPEGPGPNGPGEDSSRPGSGGRNP